jgi:hypothetical protein
MANWARPSVIRATMLLVLIFLLAPAIQADQTCIDVAKENLAAALKEVLTDCNLAAIVAAENTCADCFINNYKLCCPGSDHDCTMTCSNIQF